MSEKKPAPKSLSQNHEDNEILDTLSSQTCQIPQTAPPSDCKTFELTLSPLLDINDSCQEAVKTYCIRNCLYSLIVLEHGKSGKLHLHALLAFEYHHDHSDLKAYIKRHLVKPHHPEAFLKHAVTLVTQYDHDWYDRYLRKEESCITLHDNYNRDAVGLLFPSQQTQAYLQGKSNARSPCATMLDHESQWIKMFPDDSSLLSASRYYDHRANVRRDLVVPTDEAKQTAFIKQLWKFRNKISEPTPDRLKWAAKFDPPPKPSKKAKLDTDREYLKRLRDGYA